MNKQELLDAYEHEARKDYGRRCLLPCRKEHAGQPADALLDGRFELNHLGTIAASNATKVAARRSDNATRNVTSMIMPPDSIRTITT